jgi:hypothetical protein
MHASEHAALFPVKSMMRNTMMMSFYALVHDFNDSRLSKQLLCPLAELC